MAATAGKKALLKISTNGTTFTKALNIKSASIEIDGQNLDISQLGDDWMSRIQGMKDAKISASGSYDTADTTGQVAIRSALINDTALYAQLLPDGTTGFQMQVKVAKLSVNASTSTEAQVSIDLEQTGGITLV